MLKFKLFGFIRSISLCFLFSILILFQIATNADSAQVTLAWDPSPAPDVAGYRIYYGVLSGQYSSSVVVGNQTSYTLSNLSDGKTYYMAATAYDREGYESHFSNELVFNAPSACTYSVSPVSQSFGPQGGTAAVSITTTSGCNWTAVSNASWLVVTSNTSRTGNGVVNYSVLANTAVSSRTGTLTIAGQTFTVNQVGVLQYTLNIIKAGTGSGTVTNNPTGTTFSPGTVVTLTATPDSNSTFAGWSGGCSGTSSTGTVTMTGNTSVTATFGLKTYILTASAEANGSVSPPGAVTVNYGTNQTFTITPNTGYSIADVRVDGVSVGKVSSYTFTNVTANHTLQASFTGTSSYTLTITKAGTGSGTVTCNPSGTTFSPGTVVTLTAAPDASSTFTGWSGGKSGTLRTCTVTMNGNTSVTATFTLKTYALTASAGFYGSISPKGSVKVSYGGGQTFTITPNANYKVSNVKVDGVSKGPITTYTFSNVTSKHSISAYFAILSYTITASAGSNGLIYPKGSVTVSYGGSKTFTIRPNANYKVADVKVDGVSMGAITSYTFRNVTSSHSISATFITK